MSTAGVTAVVSGVLAALGAAGFGVYLRKKRSPRKAQDWSGLETEAERKARERDRGL